METKCEKCGESIKVVKYETNGGKTNIIETESHTCPKKEKEPVKTTKKK